MLTKKKVLKIFQEMFCPPLKKSLNDVPGLGLKITVRGNFDLAVGPGHVGEPRGSTKNKNFVSEKCELNNNILLKLQFFFNALN